MGAFTITISVKDAKGAGSTTELNFPSTYDFGDIVLFAQQQAQRIQKLIKGAITRIGVTQDVDLPGTGITTTPDPDSDVEEGAKFQYRTAGGFFTSLRLPTIDEDKVFVAGTVDVDFTDADVTDFNDAMVTGAPVVALGGVLSPSDKRDDDIIALEFAREDFQSSRK